MKEWEKMVVPNEADEIEQARESGFIARLDGFHVNDNPYSRHKPHYRAWRDGFLDDDAVRQYELDCPDDDDNGRLSRGH